MTINEIKERTKDTAPYFFSEDTMKWFGQTLYDFRVEKQKDGRFKISAPSGDNWEYKHESIHYFNPNNNKLEIK